MTAYEETFEFTAYGALAMPVSKLTLGDDMGFDAKGALAMSSAEAQTFEFTAKGALAMPVSKLTLLDTMSFDAFGALEQMSDDMSFGAKGVFSMEDTDGFDLDALPVKNITISKTVQDIYWNCVAKLDGLVDITCLDKEFGIYALDHNDVNRLLFGGLVPGRDLSQVTTLNETVLTGWDHGFYLAAQKVPTGLLHIDKEINPKDVIEALLSQSGTAMSAVKETFEPDIYATECLRRWGATYSTVHDGDNGDIVAGEVYAGQSAPPSYWFVFRDVVAFDTSKIGIAGRVESAKLRLHVKNKTDFDNGDALVIQNGQPTYPHFPLAVGDFSKSVMSGNGGEIAGSDIEIDRWIQIELNADGLDWINKTGTTKFYVRSQRDIDGTEPTGYENIEFYPDGAELVITYFPQAEPDWFWTTGIEPYNLMEVTNWADPSNIVFSTDLYATKCLRRWGNNYISCHEATSGDIVTGEVYTGQSAPPSYYFLFKNVVGFDTSSLGLGCKIVSAKLKIYVDTKGGAFEDSDKLIIQSGQPTYPHDPLEGGDYNKENISGNGGEIAGSLISSSSWIEIDLSNEGITWIDRVGTTKFYLRSLKEIDFIEPTGYELIEFSTAGAQLDITYYPETDIPKKAFEWDAETTKEEAIMEISKYCEFVFAVKPRENPEGVIPISSAYFIPDDEVDTELDLPAMITITKDINDEELISVPSADNKYAEKINRVIVRGTDPLTGNWYIAVEESQAVIDKEERPIEFYYESIDLFSQGLTNAKAENLFDFYNHTPDIYKALFEQRFDLQLYQKIKFMGFDKIPEVEMRITEMKYFMGARKPDGPIIKQVDIGFTSDKALSDLIALEKSMTSDFLSEIRKLIRELKLAELAVGTITEIDGNEATVQLEKDGTHVKARLINQE